MLAVNYDKITTRAHEMIKHAANSGMLPPETAERFLANDLKSVSHILYVKHEITGKSDTADLVKASDSKQDGVRNLDRAKLDKFENMAVDRIGFAWFAGESDSAINLYSPGVSGAVAIHPALFNADLLIKQNDRVLFEIPVSALLSMEPQGLLGGPENTFAVYTPFIIREEVPIRIQLRFPEGAGMTPPTGRESDQYWVKVELFGTRTQEK
ncbi:hypothetical protein AAG747_14070 [Rapidithrix thailandica]|uniref:DUF4469 domain-containing protein n=1 Tax=Rapidithrix thailandica TaxID=413964 RepID=A0AAW9S7Q7_9BACT